MIAKIRENIYLGNRDDARLLYLTKEPITAILNVAEELSSEKHKGIMSVKAGMKDTAEDCLRKTNLAVSLLEQLVNQGETVLVHCRAGRSRSPHVIATYLSRKEGRPYAEVYEELRSKRPKVAPLSMGEEISWKFGKEWS